MIHLNIIVIGKLKENYWREAEQEYLKRLSPWTKISLEEIKEEAFDEKSNKTIIKNKEGEEIIKKIKTGLTFILDEHGDSFTSLELAEKLEHLADQTSTINFIIGGPLGLSDALLKKYPKISFSKMTFPHQMMRIFLLEQLYRSFMINSNKKYHY
ncbi:MAG TPA: 23S rRNA (pseudouridine(1915)-N(3))-methyltransferase RlmH [Candidatus Magasanikbacteria bacterium]|nr:23S rRNA (pseudouridine(1915)-N(3))-methyltransferase RlmH [Candidatus Magasanikbacteria bacterium]